MTELNFIWKKRVGKFASGENLYVNHIRVGGWDYNIARIRGDEANKYQGAVQLPSLTDESRTIYGADPDKIKVQIEKIVAKWCEEFTNSCPDFKPISPDR